MNRTVRIATLSLAIITLVFALPGSASSKVGKEALKNCKELAFSVEEDFLSQGPEPQDGNPIISDGDLLGLNCAVCARNADLIEIFDIPEWVDLGLDAVDVVDVDAYLVAFSTELDSPNTGQFTAGDLLVTNGAIIANRALTYAFGQGAVSYDIGLDGLQFVGDPESIMGFLYEILQYPRSDWLQNPERLSRMLTDANIDLWFSTEGTWTPVGAVGFLDGDLLSARDGVIVASNDDLLPPGVPAGIPVEGVDFGLDAVTNDRSIERANLHYSTEILFENGISFSDGDVLKMGDGVVAKNIDLLGCFEAKAKELGLDALSVGTRPPPECINRITKIGGVEVEDIGLSDGLIISGTLPYNASAPFGGRIDFQGSICNDVDKFRIVYRKHGSSDPWEPMKVPPSKTWTVAADAFIPTIPDCLGDQTWFSDSDGWFNGSDYRHLSSPSLGGCNSDLSLTIWDSTTAASGADELYELALETMVASVAQTDTLRLVQLDNTLPIVELEKISGICADYTSEDMPILVNGRMQDAHFYQYQMSITGDGYPIYPYSPVAYYDSSTDNVIETGTINWNTFVGLHNVDVFDLSSTAVDCGYTVLLTGWDRTLWSWFYYSSNLVTRCSGCRYTVDAWSFKFVP
ncbi:MAG: hypothetical protein JXA78_16530 [Anaerolineales bacterium]|nr:hypothetical protein [Anaerolineales bacterium]